jgi:hypothetical protein
MGVEFAAERRLLAEDELAFVQNSHYPMLDALPREDLVPLARALRERHARAQTMVRTRRRARRGQTEAALPAERGMAAKKQVFARALKRVNTRLTALAAAEKRARTQAVLRAALARKAEGPAHPAGGPSANAGMQRKANRKVRPTVHGARIGSVSQAGKVRQAVRDGRGA